MEERNKVGRPKLADKKVRKEALLTSLFALLIAAIASVMGVSFLTGKTLPELFDPSSLSGSVANASGCIINEYNINETTSKVIMSCGKNVKRASLDGTNLTINNGILNGYKYYSKDRKRTIKYNWVTNNNVKSGTKNYVMISK